MERYAMLKQRSEQCCCRYCGGPLEVRMVIYNKYGGAGAELFCNQCMKIEFGTVPEIYNTAKDFIDAVEFNYFPELEANEVTEQFNVAKVCDLLSWCCKDWGLLDDRGFHLKAALEEDQPSGGITCSPS